MSETVENKIRQYSAEQLQTFYRYLTDEPRSKHFRDLDPTSSRVKTLVNIFELIEDDLGRPERKKEIADSRLTPGVLRRWYFFNFDFKPESGAWVPRHQGELLSSERMVI